MTDSVLVSQMFQISRCIYFSLLLSSFLAIENLRHFIRFTGAASPENEMKQTKQTYKRKFSRISICWIHLSCIYFMCAWWSCFFFLLDKILQYKSENRTKEHKYQITVLVSSVVSWSIPVTCKWNKMLQISHYKITEPIRAHLLVDRCV